jgi:hypothetical protein
MIAAPDVDLPGQPLLPEDQRLPVLMLSQYLFFLSRRPVSESNLHYLVSRLEGLQSLAPVFAGSESPVLQQVVAQLRHLHPAAFRRLAPSLQLSLLPLAKAARPLPSDVIVSDCALDARWLADVRHALLVLGPGIGIGDELILAPLPQWLKNENPSLEVTTLSGYKGFWSRVKGVDHERQYSAHLDLLKALRGGEPYDLVIFADFEAPELYRGVAADGGVKKYLEITLGARSAFLFDSQRRWLHRLLHVTPYFANYYYALNQLLRSIGLDPEAGDRFADVVRRETPKAADRLDIFVTPFTSKYDPSCAWWSRLLTGIVRRVGPFPVTLHVDSGKHWKTRHFAIELARSVSPMLPPNVTLELARDSGSQALTLPRVYDYLDRCHAVICADSFAAHAGPLFDCLTLVLAKGELKDWQVPSDNSFYFDPESSVDGVAAAMGDLLQETLRPKSAMQLAAAFTAAELNVCAAADGLQAALRNRDPIDDAFTGRYREFAGYHRAVTAQRRQQPALLFRDSFGDAIRAPEPDADRETLDAMTLHLRDGIERWQNTNFAKYVRRASRSVSQHEHEAMAIVPPSRGAEKPEVATALLNAVRAILREQLPSGEIATYFRFGGGVLEYRRCPLLSSFVHDALGSFDLHSRWVETDLLDALPAGMQGRFVRAAALVRNRIRQFLLWEEGNDGGWRFHGRGSGIHPDVDTTACAAAAILQAPRRKPAARWRAHTGMLAERNGSDLTARVNALRFLALIGEPTEELAAEVVDAIRSNGTPAGSRYAHPLILPFCVARAWAHGALPGRESVAQLMIPKIVDYAKDDPTFGGPLGAALALNALLDFEYAGPETIAAGRYLLESALPRGGWVYGPMLESGGGAPACTTALAMTALARSGVGR